MKLIVEKEVAFRSMDGSISNDIEKLLITLTDVDIANFKKGFALLKENNFIQSIKIDLDGFVDYLNDDNVVINDEWKVDVESFVVYENAIFYYAQNKWHSGDQIESACITLEDLLIS